MSNTNITKRVLSALDMSGADLARKFGIVRGAVSQWGNNIPPSRCYELELMLKNTSDPMTRKDLRPNDWHVHWPDLRN